MIAQVIVDVVHTNVDRPFSYLIPEGMEVEQGSRVSVPLGKRRVDGFVVSLLEEDQLPADVPLQKLRPIAAVLDDYPALLPQLLTLARQLAEENHCPLSETLRLMLPAAMRTGRIQQKKELCAVLCPGVDAEKEADALRRAPKRVMVLRLLKDGQPHGVGQLAQLVSNPRDALKALGEQGLVTLTEREVFRSPDTEIEPARTTAPPLTDDQREALGSMIPSLEKGQGAFLLHGVTGSGKTEVYLAMVQRTLEIGKGAIILVPEIALTPQMVRWFHSRFGENTAVLHSRLTDGQRYDEWRRIRSGQARVVVGARSAVFAPVDKLGLIVIDEEHEQTYLSDKHPRYDARRVAKQRCENEGAALVLSSATPSILSFAMARRGDYTLVEMPRRVGDRPLPQVTVVDMRKELEAGNRSIFSVLLIQKLKECLDSGHQAMLFLNRRGYNTFVSCRNCGYVVKCEQCDLSMTLHRESPDDPGQLRCHLCGAVKPPPTVCPECGSKYIRYFGSGHPAGGGGDAQALSRRCKTVRMDIDTTRGRDAHARLLDEFGKGRAQVLIGTQMIAKGLDFPKVTLVGVVAADMTLNLPDYRSRGADVPAHYAGGGPGRPGAGARRGDRAELQAGRSLHSGGSEAGLPGLFREWSFPGGGRDCIRPLRMLCRLLVESPDEAEAKDTSERLYDTLQTYLLSHPVQKKKTLMIRADEAPVKRIRGQYRYHVLLKLFDQPETAPLLRLMSELTAHRHGTLPYLR